MTNTVTPQRITGNGSQAGPSPGSASTSPNPIQGWVMPLVVLIVGSFVSVLDTSIVNVAISRIQNEFGATTDEVQWVANGYTLTLGVVVPLSSWLGVRFGFSRLISCRCWPSESAPPCAVWQEA